MNLSPLALPCSKILGAMWGLLSTLQWVSKIHMQLVGRTWNDVTLIKKDKFLMCPMVGVLNWNHLWESSIICGHFDISIPLPHINLVVGSTIYIMHIASNFEQGRKHVKNLCHFRNWTHKLICHFIQLSTSSTTSGSGHLLRGCIIMPRVAWSFVMYTIL